MCQKEVEDDVDEKRAVWIVVGVLEDSGACVDVIHDEGLG